LFVKHVTSEFGAILKFRDLSTPDSRKVANWTFMQLKFSRFERRKEITADELEEGVLYTEMTRNFPFVDVVWKDKGEIYSVQVTVSRDHPKSVDTFYKSRTSLGMLPFQKLNVYYLLTPSHGEANIPPSFFWKNVTADKDEIDKAETLVNFGIIRLDGDFGDGGASKREE
jgi:hypothetical protein